MGVTRELAVYLSAPGGILGDTTIDGVVARPSNAAGTLPPVYEDFYPDDDERDGDSAVVVRQVDGPAGERLFGREGLGREILNVDVDVRGKRADKSVMAGFAATQALCDKIRALVARVQTRHLCSDWPGVTGRHTVTYDEVAINPAYFVRIDVARRPHYGFRARLATAHPGP